MMNGPANIIIGDNQPTELPQMVVSDEDLQEERLMAKFSRTSEFKRLKAHLEDRIAFYQTYLPDGRQLSDVDRMELGSKWMVANTIIAEFKGIIDAYERANEIVKEKSNG
jgi:hypothetical protein